MAWDSGEKKGKKDSDWQQSDALKALRMRQMRVLKHGLRASSLSIAILVWLVMVALALSHFFYE